MRDARINRPAAVLAQRAKVASSWTDRRSIKERAALCDSGAASSPGLTRASKPIGEEGVHSPPTYLCFRPGDAAQPGPSPRTRLGSVSLVAQEQEPGAYAAGPIDLNVWIVAPSLSSGDVAFDQSSPIEGADAQVYPTTACDRRRINW